MEPFKGILHRFMRLLPFLTAPNSYRRFHYELFYPYPDVWNGSEQDTAGFFTAPKGELGPAPAPVKSGFSGVGRSRAPVHPVGHHVRSYLRCIDVNHAGSYGGEPFC